MKPIRKEVSWKFLDEFRGKVFDSTWPTLPQVLHISQIRFPDRPCFVDFEGVVPVLIEASVIPPVGVS